MPDSSSRNHEDGISKSSSFYSCGWEICYSSRHPCFVKTHVFFLVSFQIFPHLWVLPLVSDVSGWGFRRPWDFLSRISSNRWSTMISSDHLVTRCRSLKQCLTRVRCLLIVLSESVNTWIFLHSASFSLFSPAQILFRHLLEPLILSIMLFLLFYIFFISLSFCAIFEIILSDLSSSALF